MTTNNTHTYILVIPQSFDELISFNAWFYTRRVDFIERGIELAHFNTYFLKLGDNYYSVNEQYYRAIKKVLNNPEETILDNKGE